MKSTTVGAFTAVQMKRLLKPGGLLYLGVPVGNDTLHYNAHRVYGQQVRLHLPWF